MARLNPRLLPLVETLIEVGADWLAVEMIETLDSGRWPEESEEALAATRRQVRLGVQRHDAELAGRTVGPEPIALDEQIEWATTFVTDRLDAALGDLAGSLTNLDAIIGVDPNDHSAEAQDRRPATVRLGAEGARAEVAAGDIEQARAGMHALRTALARWSRETSGERE